MEDNWRKALKISSDIWNEYLSPCDNSFNLQIFHFLLSHYFLFRYEEIAKEYNIPTDNSNTIELAKKCFKIFAERLENDFNNYEIVNGNLKEGE